MKKMHIKPVLFTTDSATKNGFWFEKHFDEILDTQRSCEDVIVDDYEVIYVDPQELRVATKINSKGHVVIDFDWFEKQFTEVAREMGFNYVGFHFNRTNRRDWGLSDRYGGSYTRDKDDMYEFWICCDRNQEAPDYGTTKYRWEFIRLMLHEGGHGFTHFAGVRKYIQEKFGLLEKQERYHLPTHYFDYEVKDIKQLYYHISFKKWSMKLYIVELLRQIVALLTLKLMEPTPPKQENPEKDYLREWALAIQEFEGYLNPQQYPPNGTISYRQNNPGNLRWSPFENGSANGFAVFDTYAQGFEALIHQLRIAATGESRVYTPDMTLLRFFEVYAPSSDNNHPEKYAAFVADRLGVPVGTRISQLI